MDVPGVYYAGSHGFDIDGPGGTWGGVLYFIVGRSAGVDGVAATRASASSRHRRPQASATP